MINCVFKRVKDWENEYPDEFTPSLDCYEIHVVSRVMERMIHYDDPPRGLMEPFPHFKPKSFSDPEYWLECLFTGGRLDGKFESIPMFMLENEIAYDRFVFDRLK